MLPASRPGRDLAVCTLNDDGLGDMLIPSLTSQAAVDPTAYLAIALDWILHPERPWQGPLLVQPERCVVAARESTAARCSLGVAPPMDQGLFKLPNHEPGRVVHAISCQCSSCVIALFLAMIVLINIGMAVEHSLPPF